MPNAVLLAWRIDTEFVLDELDEAQAGEYWVLSLLASIVGWLSVELTWLTHGLSAPAHICQVQGMLHRFRALGCVSTTVVATNPFVTTQALGISREMA
jgi:hypothetical protein